jgi:hypothetical protein
MPSNPAACRPPLLANRRLRFGLSILLIGHLWAVIGRPLEFATQGPFGTSPSISTFFAPVRGYSQFAYLDHGYAFFAPDPGPCHFFQAAVTDSAGKLTEYKFPELAAQWPRLLYHRHFMLAEFFNDVHHPPGKPPAEIAANALATADWVRGRKRFDDVRNSLLHHLRTVHPRCEVAIRRVEHRQPGLPEFFGGGFSTRDQRLMRVLFDTVDGLPIPPPETLAAPPAEPAS